MIIELAARMDGVTSQIRGIPGPQATCSKGFYLQRKAHPRRVPGRRIYIFVITVLSIGSRLP
jgi:hypothetical protein